MSRDIEITITWEDEEWIATVDFDVTSWGSPGSSPSFSHPGDPPEPPEFEINSIAASDDDGNTITLEWDHLSEKDQQRIDEAIYEQLAEGPDDYPYYD